MLENLALWCRLKDVCISHPPGQIPPARLLALDPETQISIAALAYRNQPPIFCLLNQIKTLWKAREQQAIEHFFQPKHDKVAFPCVRTDPNAFPLTEKRESDEIRLNGSHLGTVVAVGGKLHLDGYWNYLVLSQRILRTDGKVKSSWLSRRTSWFERLQQLCWEF